MGYDYHTEELLHARFDRYCCEEGLDTVNVTREFLDKWFTRAENMISLRIVVHLPRTSWPKEVVLPHIFTRDELQALFHEVDTYCPSCGQPVYKRLSKECAR